VNQQDYRLSEMRIGEPPAGHQQLSGTQILGVLGLDRKKNGRLEFVFRPECFDPGRSV